MRHTQEIDIKKDENGITMRHPAFGQLRASRVSGMRHLYGSDFKHSGYIAIEIKTSEEKRDLYRDWHHAREELIEVHVSEAQWATFVSALNIGEGVPCTIARRHGLGMIPEFDPVNKWEQFEHEFKGKLDGTLSNIDTLAKHVEEMGLPKGKTSEIISALGMIKRGLAADLPFVAASFNEHVETTLDALKAEVHGYIQNTVTRAGLDALKAPSPLELASPDE